MPYSRYIVKHSSGCYYFRYVVPAYVLVHVPGFRKEIRRSLTTCCAREAAKAARVLWVRVDNLLQALISNMHVLTCIDEIEQIALLECKTPKEQELIKSVSKDFRERLVWLNDNGYMSASEAQTASSSNLEELLSRHARYASLHQAAEKEVEQQLEEIELKLIRDKLLAKSGRVVTNSSAVTSSSSQLKISQVAAAFCEERMSADNWQQKTYGENMAIYNIFIESLDDKPFSEITPDDMLAHKAKLRKLPSNHKKRKETRDLSLEEVLKVEGLEPISVPTVNKHINRLTALFAWAKKHRYCTENLAEGLEIKTNKKQSTERDRFTIDELQRIFNSCIYRDNEFEHSYQFWLPLLGLFTGARINELSQLQITDVYEVNGIWVISINDEGEGKKIKNATSRRIVPIHPELIRIGFLRFHEKQSKIKSNKRLFNTLISRRDGYGQTASKWFGRFRKTVGITETNGTKVFHSLRHTLIDTLKQSGMEESHVSALTGQSNDKITFTRYGKDYNPALLRGVMDKLQYEGLTLDHIEWKG